MRTTRFVGFLALLTTACADEHHPASRIAASSALACPGEPPADASAPSTPPPPPTPPPPASDRCARFQPGHYVRIDHNPARGIDGLPEIDRFLSYDVRHMKGVGFQVNWADLEPQKGVYDFSILDTALGKLKARGKYMHLYIMDRSFHIECGRGGIVPDYVPVEGASSTYGIKCAARVWEAPAMDAQIRLYEAVARHFQNELHFLGFTTGEVNMSTPSIGERWSTTMKVQLVRLYRAVHAAGPNMMIGSGSGWITKAQQDELADVLEGFGSGGTITWPDTVLPGHWLWEPAQDWYDVARERRSRMLIAPEVESPFTTGTTAATRQLYDILDNDIQAHMVTWTNWHQDRPSDYLPGVVIPVLNERGGRLKNTACPF